MGTTWFTLYHVYSTKRKYDEKAIQNFEMDIKAAQKIGIDTVILEDYYVDFLWGEYTNFWSEETFRKMINVTHDYGLRFIPYLDVTELAHHGAIYKAHGRKWGAKNHWGKPYAAFSSIFLPYYQGHDFHTKLMCPGSAWFDYFTKQARILLKKFEVDGIYLDRVDYRVKCYDHSQDPDHFVLGLPELVKSVKAEVKSNGVKNLLIMNDSCVDPDPPLTQCLKMVDYVLTELLPVDTDPRNFYWQFLANWGEIFWKFRWFLKPFIRTFMGLAFSTGAMTDESRIQKIVNRLRPHVGNNILVFSHRRDAEGIKAIQTIAQRNQLDCCYISGLEFLRDVRGLVKPDKQKRGKNNS
jgi:hypothetical protein